MAAPAAPIALALAFALVSVPLVAISFALEPAEWETNGWAWPCVRLAWSQAFVLALVSAVGSALAAAAVAGVLVRRHPVAASFAAVMVAWSVGVSLLSATATVFEIPYLVEHTGDCRASLGETNPGAGIEALLWSFVLAFAFGIQAVVFLLLELIAAALGLVRRAGPGTLCVILGFVALNWWGIWSGGAVAFACLGIGVLAWARLLRVPVPAAAPVPSAAATR